MSRYRFGDVIDWGMDIRWMVISQSDPNDPDDQSLGTKAVWVGRSHRPVGEIATIRADGTGLDHDSHVKVDRG